jgi:hypothetical protein
VVQLKLLRNSYGKGLVMGYTTDFEGEFRTDRPVDKKTYDILEGLNQTRRMKRSGLPAEYGVDGEFYFEDEENYGQSHTPKMGTIVNYNEPPSTQPSLWCQWRIDEHAQIIEWDGGEKFYNYIEWIKYIVEKVLKPAGYVLNGKVEWQGEDSNDAGVIEVVDNKVYISQVERTFSPRQEV